MAKGDKEGAEEAKRKVAENSARLAELEAKKPDIDERIKKIMMTIPNIIDPSVPVGKDDSENVEIEKFGEPVVPPFEVPYHTEIMEKLAGIDLDAARKVAGNGFYYLIGDVARLHSAILTYARDFMINKGFTYCIPPFMIRSNVVTGVMSFDEMDAMMYKIEGEDLYLIGTSEHSMIGRFIDTMVDEESLPLTHLPSSLSSSLSSILRYRHRLRHPDKTIGLTTDYLTSSNPTLLSGSPSRSPSSA